MTGEISVFFNGISSSTGIVAPLTRSKVLSIWDRGVEGAFSSILSIILRSAVKLLGTNDSGVVSSTTVLNQSHSTISYVKEQ